MRVLIVRLDHLGDVLLTTPLIRAVAEAGNETHVLIRNACVPVFETDTRMTAHVVEKVAPRFPGHWLDLARWMRGMKFDVIMLPHAEPRQLLFASALSGARKRIAMWSGIAGRLTFHQCLPSGIREGERHFSDILLDCARAADIPVAGSKPDFLLSSAEIDAARADLEKHFPGCGVIGVHPGCAGNTCNLPPQVFGEIAARLLEEPGVAVIATGIAQERSLIDSWPEAVLNHPRFYNSCGEWKLRELAAHIANFRTMVVPSTGPLHICAAYSLPTVTAFCNYPSVSAAVWGNLTPGSIVISPSSEFCRECRSAPGAPNCDFRGTISAERVAAAALQLFASRTGATNGG